MQPAVNWTYRARLHRIVDGDTADLLIDLGFGGAIVQRIRLDGIDTKEIVGPDRAAALEAKMALGTMLAGAPLLVTTRLDKMDGLRRYLGTIWLARPTEPPLNVNQWLLDEGHAKVWSRK